MNRIKNGVFLESEEKTINKIILALVVGALFGGYNDSFDFYEDDELVASVNPSKVKKKQL